MLRPTYPCLYSYEDLLSNACFVKFKSKEQIEKYGRTYSKDTIEWWAKQSEYVRKISLDPSPDDVPVTTGIQYLYDYVNRYPNADTQTFWMRGSLDQVCAYSLLKALDLEPFTRYSNWRDLRTAIDILYGSTNGYCDIDEPSFNRDLVIKHHPAHDVCLDVMMLLHGRVNA